MNYYITQIPVSPAPVPTVYLDFPPDLLVTVAYLMFAFTFHLTGYNITKLIYGH